MKPISTWNILLILQFITAQKSYLYLRAMNKSFFDRIVYTLILLSIASIVAESFESFNSKYGRYLNIFQTITYILFTAEYIYRTINAARKRSWKSYVFSFFGIIDLLAIIPFILPFIISVDARSIRVLRLFRLLLIFKIGRHSKAVRTLLSVVKSIRVEVGVTFFTSIIAIVLAGILMYYAENDVQPEAFADMGKSIWWAVATLTTVGYGDIYPITIMGKFIATSLAFIGVGLIAIPAGLISAAYVEEVNSLKEKNKK